MEWQQLMGGIVVAAGAAYAAEIAGGARGHQKFWKNFGVALSGVGGIALLVALWQFDWVKNPSWWLAMAAAVVLLVMAVRALRDLSDGQPDRQCRVAVLALPLLLVVGGAWLADAMPSMVERGTDHIVNSTQTDQGR